MRITASSRTESDRSTVYRRRLLKAGGLGIVSTMTSLSGCLGDLTSSGDGGGGGDAGGDAGDGGSSAAWERGLDTDREFWIVTGDVADRDSFFPSTNVVNAGETVGVHLKNTGDELHDMDVEAFGVEQELEAGEVTTFTFTADQPGVHTIECEEHPDWMYGQLVVLPESGTEIPTVDDRALRIVMGDVAERDSYMPSTHAVVEGEEVAVKLKNTGDEDHDLDVEAFGVEQELEPGEMTRFSFTADQPGIHTMECEEHPDWMYGQLLVLPADGDYSRIEASSDRQLRIVMGDVAERDSFFPSTNVVKAGEEVAVKLKNTGDEDHDLDVEAFGVEQELEPGEMTRFSFTADQPGIHTMECEDHPPEMVGQLLVIE